MYKDFVLLSKADQPLPSLSPILMVVEGLALNINTLIILKILPDANHYLAI